MRPPTLALLVTIALHGCSDDGSTGSSSPSAGGGGGGGSVQGNAQAGASQGGAGAPQAGAGAPSQPGGAGASAGGAVGAAGATAVGGSAQAGQGAGPIGEVVSGTITYYAATGEGACSFDASPGDLDVGALDTASYDGAGRCGACALVEGPRGSVTVRIVDLCPDCGSPHLDLSESAFAKVADPVQGRVEVSWSYVPCAVSGPVSFRFKEGSSQWWTAIQVRNHRVPVASLEVKREGAWVALPRESYNYFVAGEGVGVGPIDLRVTAITGEQIVETGIAVGDGVVVQGTQQL